jgi:hypothetical protein
VGIISRVQAADGFVFASQWERRERYTVVIEGVITQIHALSTVWSVPSPPSRLTSANGDRECPLHRNGFRRWVH